VTILTDYNNQLTGKNILARFSISSLGNTKLNICCANIIISIHCHPPTFQTPLWS